MWTISDKWGNIQLSQPRIFCLPVCLCTDKHHVAISKPLDTLSVDLRYNDFLWTGSTISSLQRAPLRPGLAPDARYQGLILNLFDSFLQKKAGEWKEGMLLWSHRIEGPPAGTLGRSLHWLTHTHRLWPRDSQPCRGADRGAGGGDHLASSGVEYPSLPLQPPWLPCPNRQTYTHTHTHTHTHTQALQGIPYPGNWMEMCGKPRGGEGGAGSGRWEWDGREWGSVAASKDLGRCVRVLVPPRAPAHTPCPPIHTPSDGIHVWYIHGGGGGVSPCKVCFDGFWSCAINSTFKTALCLAMFFSFSFLSRDIHHLLSPKWDA